MAKIATRSFSSPFLIGLFIIVGTFILISLIIWLGASKFFQQNKYYVTYFDTSVEGLETGSPVKYQGVPVGTIDKIHVAPDGKLIEIVMKIEDNIDIDPRLRVKAEYAGIAGGKFLQLFYPEEPDLARLHPKINFEAPYKIIQSAPSGIERIEIAVQNVIKSLENFKAKEISDETLKLLQESTHFFENKQLYEIVNQLADASHSIQSMAKTADTSGIARNLGETSRRILETANKLDRFADSISVQIAGLNLKARVDNTFNQLDTTLQVTKSTVSILGYRGEALLYGLNETIDQIKTSSKQLRKTLRALSDNPSQMFFSEPPPKDK